MSPVFATIHAAEHAHVEPWALEAQSLFWQMHILEKADVEAKAAKTRAANEKRNLKRRQQR